MFDVLCFMFSLVGLCARIDLALLDPTTKSLLDLRFRCPRTAHKPDIGSIQRKHASPNPPQFD